MISEILGHLFPAFKSRLNAKDDLLGTIEVLDGSQRLAYRPNFGLSYLERYLAGTLPESEVPDQPTLQYIRKIEEYEFNEREFKELYLSSYDKLTRDINKLIQFSYLLSIDAALLICDSMMAWLSIQKNANVWPKPEKFIDSMIYDVVAILKNFGSQNLSIDVREGNWDKKEKWIKEKIEEFGTGSTFLCDLLLACSKNYILNPDTYDSLKKRLAENLYDDLIIRNTPFENRLMPQRPSLGWLIEIMRKHDEYDSFKRDLTEKLINESNADSTNRLKGIIVRTLVMISHPVMEGEIPIKLYKFEVSSDANEKKYDMSLILPALDSWKNIKFEDDVAEKAFDHLANAYKFIIERKSN